MKIKDLNYNCPPDDATRLQMENPPVYRFKDKPVYDDKGNIVDFKSVKYDPFTPPLEEDIEVDTSFDLKDPSTYAAVIVGNDGVDITEQSPYNSFSATTAFETLANEINNPD